MLKSFYHLRSSTQARTISILNDYSTFCSFSLLLCIYYNFIETSTYVVETAALQEILLNLPDNDHRAILSQLMIMANAREEVSRMNIALQVKDSLLNIIEKNEIEVDSEQTIKLIMHLARLKKPYRSLFGRSLFKAMSRLFKRTEKLKEKCKKEKREFLLDQERSQQSKQIIDRQGNNGDTGISV